MSRLYRADFDIFKNNNIAYLDTAATSQRPNVVLDKMMGFSKTYNSNIHRGSYNISVQATMIYNEAREKIAKFINAKQKEEIVITKNCTESINLVAYSYGIDNLKKGDEILISIMEHHSNLVVWQRIAKITGAKLCYLYIDKDYIITKEEIDSKINENTKIVAITSVSNVLGVKTDLEYIVKKSHEVGAVVLADLCQLVPHEKFDVQKFDVDFAAFSSHKMYGPLGIGILYGKMELLDKMSPFLMGGDMIEFVHEQTTSFAPTPTKFEAGTQDVEGVYGLGCAIDYLNTIGFDTIKKDEEQLYNYTITKLKELDYLDLYVSDKNKASSVISFNVKNIHPHDVASILDMKNVCIRSGNHCAQPLLRFLGLDSTCRLSFGLYTTEEEIEMLLKALDFLYNKFSKYIRV